MYLGSLGVTVSDLPLGGKNLRIYTYDPIGSAFYKPPGEGYQYNSGHYDITLPGGPCSQSDPQGFPNWQSMSTYAGSRGEMLMLVNRDDLPSLCSARPATPAPTPAPAPQPGAPAPTGGPIIVQQPAPAGPDTTIKVPVRPISTSRSTQPIIITTPGGGGPVYLPSPGGPPAGTDGGLPLPWILGGAAVLFLLARR